jgi:hypothetical protein
MKDFYLTLASNSSMNYYHENKTSNFSVKLPKTLTLDGKWVVAVTEIHYQNTFLNVSEGSNSISYRRHSKKKKFTSVTDDTLEHCSIQTRDYNSIQDILNAINFFMNPFLKIEKYAADSNEENTEKEPSDSKQQKIIVDAEKTNNNSKQDEVKTNLKEKKSFIYQTIADAEKRKSFIYQTTADAEKTKTNNTSKQGEVKTNPKDEKSFIYLDKEKKIVLINDEVKKTFSELYFNNRLAIQLGYEPDTNALQKSKELVRNPHISYGIADEMMIYCDIIEPQVFGHEMAKIIRIVNIGKDVLFGATCHKEYQRLHYIPLLKKEFETISIELRDKSGAFLPFEYGTVLVVLHFLKIE